VRRRRVGSAHEVADRRAGELGDSPQPRQRRRGRSALPARDGDRLDPQLLCELLLGEPRATPRGAETTSQSIGLPGAQAVGFLPHSSDSVTSTPSSPIEPDALPAPLAALVALGEKERTLPTRQAVPEDPAQELHSAGSTFTSILPMFSPWSIPMNAAGAFSIPSTTVSRYRSLPSRTHSRACSWNSRKRS